jgi:hypothetical protein
MKSCATCTESIGSSLGLICVLRTRLATEPCEHWEREPGACDDMQVRPASVAVRPIQPMLYGSNVAGHDGPGGAVPAGEFAAERERGTEA